MLFILIVSEGLRDLKIVEQETVARKAAHLSARTELAQAWKLADWSNWEEAVGEPADSESSKWNFSEKLRGREAELRIGTTKKVNAEVRPRHEGRIKSH